MANYIDGMDEGKHNSDNTEHTTPQNKKKLYSIQHTAPATNIWYYEVEAESEEEALAIVMNGDAEVVDYEIYSDGGEDEYAVMDVEDIK